MGHLTTMGCCTLQVALKFDIFHYIFLNAQLQNIKIYFLSFFSFFKFFLLRLLLYISGPPCQSLI